MGILQTFSEWVLSAELSTLRTNIADLQNKINDLNNKQNIKEAPILSTITNGDVCRLLLPLCGVIYLSDNQYDLTSISEASKFTESTKVANGKWTTDAHDCDNFSFASMGYWSDGLYSFAYGIAWSQGHAFNIMIDDQKQVWIVEPQTNDYMTIDEAKAKKTPDGLLYFPLRLVIM